MNKSWLFFALLLFWLPSSAQNEFTLSQLIDRVVAENYQIRMVANDATIAANNHTLGNAGFLPIVDAEASQTWTVNNIDQQLANGEINQGNNAQSSNLSGLVGLNWTVFDGFRMFAMHNKLGALAEIGKLDARFYINQTVADVSLAYYELLQGKALLDNYQMAQEISRFRYQLEGNKRTLGSGSGLLYNQAKTDYLSDSAKVLEQQNALKSLEIEINRLMNLPLDQALDLAAPEADLPLLKGKEVLLNQAKEANQNLKKALLEELVAEANLRMERSNRYPQVDLFANYSFSRQVNQVGFIRSNQNVGPGAGVSVRFNLFNGGNVNRTVKNAEINQASAELNTKSNHQLVEKAVLLAFNQYQNASERLAIAKTQQQTATTSLEIARQQYEAGTIDGYNFRLTQLSLIDANNRVIQLRFAIQSATVELLRLTDTIVERSL